MSTTPRIGDIVHYIPSDEELAESHAGPHVWQAECHYPAIIVRVISPEDGLVLLTRFSQWGTDSPVRLGELAATHDIIRPSSTCEPGYWHSRKDCDQ